MINLVKVKVWSDVTDYDLSVFRSEISREVDPCFRWILSGELEMLGHVNTAL